MLLSTKKVRSCVAADAEGNVYVSEIVTDTSDPTYACSDENVCGAARLAATPCAERQRTFVERLPTVDIVEYSSAEVATASRSDEHQSGVLAVSLCLDSRHEGVVEDLKCAERKFLAANDKRRRAAIA